DGHAEHMAVAAAADCQPVELFAAYNLTDMRDVALFGAHALAVADPPADAEGCTALQLPPSHARQGAFIQAQTWDLNPGDIDYVVAVHRLPAAGPESWTVSLVGAPCLMVMNEHGLSLGTTNIKTRDARPGVGYMNVLHAAARCRHRAAAVDLIAAAPRAAAHTFWVADASGACELECSAERCRRRECATAPLVQTNHCLDPEIAALAAEEPSASSQARLARAQAILAQGEHDLDSLQVLFSDRSDGVDSINRLHEDRTDTATNACAVMQPAARRFDACRGPSDRGRWQLLAFENG
ncbi:MAG: C45 family autoproteolytic acyltransferase/hydrolase, partial [Planctomycetota bacterium]